MRDYGTGQWDGGDDGCDHVARLSTSALAESPASTRGGAKKVPEARDHYRDVCGKCGARRVDRQLGLEPTPEQYVANMVAVFREVRRVLAAHGTCWVNLGDSYANERPGAAYGWTNGKTSEHDAETIAAYAHRPPPVAPKNLLGMPWRVAFALQADGWYLRSDIVWSKPNPMPESVTDRPTKAHEYVFLLSKGPRYFFDQEAVREPSSPNTHSRGQGIGVKNEGTEFGQGIKHNENYARAINGHVSARNIRSVWEIATQPYSEAHFATFPEALVERCLKAGTSERGKCPACGAPWDRIVETNNPSKHAADPDKTLGWANTHSKTSNAQSSKSLHRNPGGVYSTAVVKGWRPTCECSKPRTERATSAPTTTTSAKSTMMESASTAPSIALSETTPSTTLLTPEPCVVLDPFMGSGTTALVARRLGRHAVGIELNEDYAALCARRLQQLSLLA